MSDCLNFLIDFRSEIISSKLFVIALCHVERSETSILVASKLLLYPVIIPVR